MIGIKKENKTEEQIREELLELITSEHYQEINKLVRNPPPMDVEEI